MSKGRTIDGGNLAPFRIPKILYQRCCGEIKAGARCVPSTVAIVGVATMKIKLFHSHSHGIIENDRTRPSLPLTTDS